jgi:hypothetical protein
MKTYFTTVERQMKHKIISHNVSERTKEGVDEITENKKQKKMIAA